jgi:disulfide oxidoreductase YuzD
LGIPFDVTNPDELKTMLATCGADVINALDNGRIHFDKMEDKAAFYGLLTVTTDYVMDGRIRTAFTKARMN